jgi:hypothetical protein
VAEPRSRPNSRDDPDIEDGYSPIYFNARYERMRKKDKGKGREK